MFSRSSGLAISISTAILLLDLLVAPRRCPAEDETARPDAQPTRVAVLVFPGVELLDFAGPAEVFASARDADENALFDVCTVGPSKKPLNSMRFLSITPQYDPTDAPQPDMVVLPGGNVEVVMNNPELLAWIQRQHDAGSLMFSVCNGASVLAKLGYLDGLDVATHHDNIPLLELLAPKAKCHRDRKFVDNGKIVTAAGISSGIDAALYVVSRLMGADVAKRVATYVEYDHYVGFDASAADQVSTDANGTVFQKGRVHDSQPWAIVRLIDVLREKGSAEALAEYPRLLESTSGNDRQMIESVGISMSTNWLLKHGRDREIAFALLRFNVAANPDSPLAHTDLGNALLESGDKPGAKSCFERAIAIDPDNKRARELLDKCLQ